MLDFYLIKDATARSNHCINNVDYLGGIDYTDFEYLQNNHIIEQHLDYYEDFRWTSEQVCSKLKLLSKLADADNAHKLFIAAFSGILKKAEENGSGIIAYCD